MGGVPSFGVKIDAIPGRVNDAWFKVERPGLHFGQCFELCGKDHAFMPITVQAVPPEDYDAWKARMLARQKGGATEYARQVRA